MNPQGESDPEADEMARPTLLEWAPALEVFGGLALASGRPGVWLVDLDAGLEPGEAVESAEPGPELAILSDDERARAARFLRARDRQRFARCRAALRQLLGRLLDEPPQSLRFRAAARGKPELDRAAVDARRDDCPAPRFNVSHSSGLALIAVCQGRELGVDIEQVRPISEADRIVESFFTTAEQAEFAALGSDDKSLAFHRGWTRKEAVLKGWGMGISGLSARHETGFGTTRLTTRFTPASPSPQVDRWVLWEAAPRPGFVAALAVDNRPDDPGSLPSPPPKP